MAKRGRPSLLRFLLNQLHPEGLGPMPRVKNANAVMTGIFLVGVALTAFYLTTRLSSFTEIGLGSGFLPRLFATILLCFGVVLAVMGFRVEGDPPARWNVRSWGVLAAIAFFGMTIDRMGMAVAVAGLVLISCLAHKGTKLTESLPLAIGAIFFCWLIFIKAVGLVIPMWPRGM